MAAAANKVEGDKVVYWVKVSRETAHLMRVVRLLSGRSVSEIVDTAVASHCKRILHSNNQYKKRNDGG